MDYEELKDLVKKYDRITLQTAAKLFRETNKFEYGFKESLEVATNVFNELGLL